MALRLCAVLVFLAACGTFQPIAIEADDPTQRERVQLVVDELAKEGLAYYGKGGYRVVTGVIRDAGKEGDNIVCGLHDGQGKELRINTESPKCLDVIDVNIVHELGHAILGPGHSEDPLSIMYESNAHGWTLEQAVKSLSREVWARRASNNCRP